MVAAVVRRLDGVGTNEDDASAEKAGAGDNLRGNAGGIEHYFAVEQNVGEAILRNEQEKCGSETNESVRAEAGALLAKLALEADQRGEDEGTPEFQDLPETFA